MKKTIYRIALVTGLVAAGSLSAIAEPGDGEKKGPRGPRGPGGPGPGPDREEMLKKFDKDGSGDLNEEERKAARAAGEARRAEFIAKHDSNKDGKLDEEERKAAQKAMLLERFDADGSGDLNAEEQAKADAAQKRMRAARERGPRGGKPGPGKRQKGGEDGE